ncbi:Tetratricopeptide repeat [Phytophthora infestans]|nr:Tetratricopeptide repeat [Phytophthora infestans]
MTIATASKPDFFSLHTRKPKTIDVEMLDYSFVERCTDVDELKGILAVLRSGKEGRYPDLEKATEDRILAVFPERERTKILRMRSGPTDNELTTEIDALANWAVAMNVKNEALKKQTPFKRELPPVRGRKSSIEMRSDLARAPAKLANVEKDEQKMAKNAIPAYDFRSWEKYDVDKALEEIDHEGERARDQARKQQEEQEKRAASRKREFESLSKSVDLDKLQPETRKMYAGYEKQKGNDCFKANELEVALLHYTRSMAYDDTDAILYANRALVYLKTKNFAAAEDDCARAILLDPTYMKGWSRRGMTRYRRGKYAESVQDFEEALRLDPDNREVTKLMKAAKEKHGEVNGVKFSNQVSPTNHEADEKPFKRFEIIEDEEEKEKSSQQNQQYERSRSSEKPFTRFEIIEEEGSEDEDDD